MNLIYDRSINNDLQATHSGSQGDVVARTAIMGALQLYLDFLNMFMSLLRLLGDRR